jgi:hypothetical protein
LAKFKGGPHRWGLVGVGGEWMEMGFPRRIPAESTSTQRLAGGGPGIRGDPPKADCGLQMGRVTFEVTSVKALKLVEVARKV